jgi:DNA-binding CsgD family transcriptional regulator
MKVSNQLSQLELEILRQVAEGKSTAEIAHNLAADTAIIEYRLSHIYNCYRAGTRAELIAGAERDGCLTQRH